MNCDKKESFRKWATFVLSTLALVVTSLRDPIALTFKVSVQDVVRQELARHNISAATEARTQNPPALANEALTHLEHDLAAIRAEAATGEASHELLVEVDHCLLSMEKKLDLFLKECQRERKLQSGKDDL